MKKLFILFLSIFCLASCHNKTNSISKDYIDENWIIDDINYSNNIITWNMIDSAKYNVIINNYIYSTPINKFEITEDFISTYNGKFVEIKIAAKNDEYIGVYSEPFTLFIGVDQKEEVLTDSIIKNNIISTDKIPEYLEFIKNKYISNYEALSIINNETIANDIPNNKISLHYMFLIKEYLEDNNYIEVLNYFNTNFKDLNSSFTKVFSLFHKLDEYKLNTFSYFIEQISNDSLTDTEIYNILKDIVDDFLSITPNDYDISIIEKELDTLINLINDNDENKEYLKNIINDFIYSFKIIASNTKLFLNSITLEDVIEIRSSNDLIEENSMFLKYEGNEEKTLKAYKLFKEKYAKYVLYKRFYNLYIVEAEQLNNMLEAYKKLYQHNEIIYILYEANYGEISSEDKIKFKDYNNLSKDDLITLMNMLKTNLDYQNAESIAIEVYNELRGI